MDYRLTQVDGARFELELRFGSVEAATKFEERCHGLFECERRGSLVWCPVRLFQLRDLCVIASKVERECQEEAEWADAALEAAQEILEEFFPRVT